MGEFWEERLILRTLSGSRAHGLAREGSDTDTRGVCIPPARYLIGLGTFEQHESSGGDHVTYALSKYVRLALQGNPNILESLFVDEVDVLFISEAGRELVDARSCFLSKQVGRRFMGYAGEQLKRMERHHRWLASPLTSAPRPEDHGASEVEGRYVYKSADAQRAFDAALAHWHHFQAWRKDRNPERAKLEERHGYDTKHAMHLVRLLKMGAEVLATGAVLVRRPDAEWLLGIRDGQFDYAQILRLADELTGQLEALLTASELPDGPDTERAEELLVRLHRQALAP